MSRESLHFMLDMIEEMESGKPHIYVGTGINPGYLAKAESFNYFRSLNDLAPAVDVTAFCVLLDFTDAQAEEMRKKYPAIKQVRMSGSEVKAANPNNCMQHGAFIEHLVKEMKLRDRDYVLFTDADMTMQRNLSDKEKEQFKSAKVFVAANWYDDETLAEEAKALGLTIPEFALSMYFPGIDKMPCWNTGVLGMTVSDWRRLFKLYAANFKTVDEIFKHYAKQQWLICYILQKHGFDLMDYRSDFVRTIHSHGHEPHSANRLRAHGVTQRDGRWWKGGDLVVLAHNLRGR